MTPAATAAKERNWRIFRLRGLYAQVSLLDADLRLDGEIAVDRQLERLGAEKESVRRRRVLAKALENFQ